jgi:hypothetical protein
LDEVAIKILSSSSYTLLPAFRDFKTFQEAPSPPPGKKSLKPLNFYCILAVIASTSSMKR